MGSEHQSILVRRRKARQSLVLAGVVEVVLSLVEVAGEDRAL